MTGWHPVIPTREEKTEGRSGKMLVSIIINNYNYARFLSTAIRSALQQDYSNIEVIVVDDGSTDGSREVVEAFGSQVRTIFKSNGGQGSAVNSGFAISKGDLIIFLDADDALKPNAASVVVESWSDQFSKLHYPLEVIDERGTALNKVFPPQPLESGDVLPLLLQNGDYCTPPTSGNVFPRWFLSRVMPMPEAEWTDCADCYLVQTAPFYGRIGKVSSALGMYRLHGSSLTAEIAKGRLRLENLQKRLRSDLRKQRLLDRFAEAHGYRMRRFAVLNSYHHLKIRFISLKMRRLEHPFQADRLLQIAWDLLQCVWRRSKLRLRTRVAYTFWVFLVATLPATFCERLIVPACTPYSRSRLRSAIVQTGLAKT